MALRSVNPANGTTLETFDAWSGPQLEEVLRQSAAVTPQWAASAVGQRAVALHGVAAALRRRREELARLISLEMGKLVRESRAEIDKCAWACDYYAEQAPEFLADEPVATDAGTSYIAYQPLGTVLAVMPWNFPFWQVFRFAAPALAAGNTALLKHASNVPQCALAIERVIEEGGVPAGVFRSLMLPADRIEGVIADPRVHAVSVTGSEATGRKVAAQAGAQLKKTVLELGGSDPFVVLEDADLELTVQNAVAARFINAGQSCIAAKRFIVVEPIAGAFLEAFKAGVEALMPGDPLQESTTLAPLARHDLRDELHKQVLDSIARGAVAVTGCAPGEGPGAYYQASILAHVAPGMRAYSEELFGPVATVTEARDAEHALALANDSPYGLGGSVWTRDPERGERLARDLACGSAFVNGMVKSDPRLPFGGIKASGYGRELARIGLHEFVNVKTLWVR